MMRKSGGNEVAPTQAVDPGGTRRRAPTLQQGRPCGMAAGARPARKERPMSLRHSAPKAGLRGSMADHDHAFQVPRPKPHRNATTPFSRGEPASPAFHHQITRQNRPVKLASTTRSQVQQFGGSELPEVTSHGLAMSRMPHCSDSGTPVLNRDAITSSPCPVMVGKILSIQLFLVQQSLIHCIEQWWPNPRLLLSHAGSAAGVGSGRNTGPHLSLLLFPRRRRTASRSKKHFDPVKPSAI
jgi:hypothetical protein